MTDSDLHRRTLGDAGRQRANKQGHSWASTGVTNPDYRDTMYVDDLVALNTVNTMPGKTLRAVKGHSQIYGDQVTKHYSDAEQVMSDL